MSKLDARSFMRRGDGLFPVDDDAIELLRMIPEDRELRVTVRQPRNPRHSARFHVMMRKTMDNVEVWSHRTYDEFLDAIKVEVGHTETWLTLAGEVRKRPKSIDFGNMDEIEFKRFEKRVVYIIQREFGFDPESLMAEVDAETQRAGDHTDHQYDVADRQPVATSEPAPSTEELRTLEDGAGVIHSPSEAAPTVVSEAAAGDASSSAIPQETSAPAAVLSKDDRTKLAKYAAAIADARTARTLNRGSSAFLEDHRIEEGSAIHKAASEIYHAHLLRIEGKSSPVEAEAVATKVLAA